MDAAEMVRAVLPVIGDLWGAPWVLDDEDDAAGGPAGGLAEDECLGDAFPEDAVLDDAEVSFRRARGDALVHALSTVLRDDTMATTAWSLLAADEFNACFAASVADSVDLDGPIELLGPVAVPTDDRPSRPSGSFGSAGATAAGDVRVATHRARLSAASPAGLRPITLDVAIIGAGTVVLLLWAATGAERGVTDGWRRLVDASARRVAAVVDPTGN